MLKEPFMHCGLLSISHGSSRKVYEKNVTCKNVKTDNTLQSEESFLQKPMSPTGRFDVQNQISMTTVVCLNKIKLLLSIGVEIAVLVEKYFKQGTVRTVNQHDYTFQMFIIAILSHYSKIINQE